MTFLGGLLYAFLFFCVMLWLWWIVGHPSNRVKILGKHGPDAWLAKACFPFSLFIQKPFKIYPDGYEFRTESGEPLDPDLVRPAIEAWRKAQVEKKCRQEFLEKIKK